ncbi:transcriptional regulator [Pseudolabrys sp. Root1462]|jgi:LuxR family quorum sensing-dependent transcriptional regulator|uniref:helix-turn-helix transcriptional regulator n=1 Tax=Pseudolabrys sp. Root1462 TaxID=1736466 RepID=UPI000702A67B|nr:LuxR family transcriptional regulator [Pseudolabrys sp. Root1462]KQY97310.1 transcriptional regulator [Pseudolabrys sp. Root1462]
MESASFDHAHEAFAFVELLEKLSSPDEIMNQMEKALGRFGFENFILTGLPNPHQKAEQMVLARKWPQGWFEIYIKENYVAVDPVVRLCRNSVNPFDWADAPFDQATEPRALEVMNRASDFRMSNGFCIPIHGLTGYEACVSLGGVDLDLSPRTKPAIHLMGMYAFEHIRQLMTQKNESRFDRLTVREREVLTWTAVGKTAAEVAEIMNLSKRTVDEYSVRAARKLRAQNKTHAVVKALQQRLISP